jgi:hypothetical protein
MKWDEREKWGKKGQNGEKKKEEKGIERLLKKIRIKIKLC